MLPVVSVFFELGREAHSIPAGTMRAFRLSDIQRGGRLHAPQQVIECLDILSQALRQIKSDAEATFYGLDTQGHCLIAESTMCSINCRPTGRLHHAPRPLWRRCSPTVRQPNHTVFQATALRCPLLAKSEPRGSAGLAT
jgi:hypothetical protein